MQEFEKLGVFYLGRPYDLKKKTTKPGWVLYDSKDLTTHAVCVGMTGSGKTGLCIALLEEAAIDGIPALAIDPKGDLGNLLLTFPQLQGAEFLPWINEEEARKKGLTPEAYAEQQAQLWRAGLAEWGQDPARIERVRASADFAIYTPGSQAGLPVSILKSFSVPSPALVEEPELLRERISTTTTSLLRLLGIEADPIQSREHILISMLLDKAWKRGQDLDLPSLVQQIQAPPFDRVGVLDLESFYPSKERFRLAMALNNLLAAPGFETWLQGEALDIDQLLYTTEGKPRVSIFSIAHLNDAERMFFVSLLLNQVIGWMRGQSGTTSLRAILYMDEIFGYFPPVANPPSKAPLLTLLKQARAFGVGVVLATQNPVDLDYKGLANAGTWLIGRLQTERDKARVLEGLEGAAASTGVAFHRGRMEELLAGLGNRVFLMHNVHEEEPEVFQTRWTLSYLRGPLTRAQIKKLMDPYKAAGARPAQVEMPVAAPPETPRVSHPARAAQRPVLPPDIPQYFLPVRDRQPAASTLVYKPAVLSMGQVHFDDPKLRVNQVREVAAFAAITDDAMPVDWDQAVTTSLTAGDLERSPLPSAQFLPLPLAGSKAKNYEAWGKTFATWLFRTQKLELFRSPALKEVSRPDESERDFRIRLQQIAHEQRDQLTERLRQKYAPKIASLTERLRRAEQTKEREAEQAKQQHLQTAISFGVTLLGALLGRKAISASSLGRATTAARGVGRSIKEAKDVARAEENIEALRQQLRALEEEFRAELEAQTAKSDPLTERLETIVLRPNKSDIAVKLTALAWVPYWQDAEGVLKPAWE